MENDYDVCWECEKEINNKTVVLFEGDEGAYCSIECANDYHKLDSPGYVEYTSLESPN